MKEGMERICTGAAMLTAMTMAMGNPPVLWAQQTPQQPPMFSATASLVPISVSVRDERGRPVVGLSREDFEVYSDDTLQPITDFRSEPSPITTALLIDKSGSMRVSSRAADVSNAAHQLVSWMSPVTDRLGLFAFDTNLTQTSAFAAVSANSLRDMATVAPFGATSLYDALDETSAALGREGSPRRAVVALTDGTDNASLLTPSQVAGRAAAIDVPVYIISVTMPIDHPTTGVGNRSAQPHLAELAAWTGGQHFVASTPSQMSLAARTIVTELRQQYLLAFVPDPRQGWHRLTVRTRQPRLTARARAGYITR